MQINKLKNEFKNTYLYKENGKLENEHINEIKAQKFLLKKITPKILTFVLPQIALPSLGIFMSFENK